MKTTSRVVVTTFFFSLLAAGCSSADGDVAIDRSTPDVPLGAEDLVDTPDEGSLAADPLPADGYMPVPGGLEVHASCVIRVEDDDVVDDDANTVTKANGDVVHVAPCAYPSRASAVSAPSVDGLSEDAAAATKRMNLNGWIASVMDWSMPHAIEEVYGTWRVPGAPKVAAKQTIFLFNGTEDGPKGTEIFQPVLQWGPSHAGGGKYWGIASWHGTPANIYYASPVKRVHAGDWIVGDSTRDKNGWWTISTMDLTSGAFSTLHNKHSHQAHAQHAAIGGVLEVYKVTRCDELARGSAVTFFNTDVSDGAKLMSPSWGTGDYHTKYCGGTHGEVGKKNRPIVKY